MELKMSHGVTPLSHHDCPEFLERMSQLSQLSHMIYEKSQKLWKILDFETCLQKKLKNIILPVTAVTEAYNQ
jgi:hypothetical protein